jgi:Tol biopolymer transport system component
MMRRLAALLVVGCSAAWLPAQDDVVKPINLAINTSKDEDDPHVSSSGLQLLFVAKPNGKWEVMLSERKSEKDAWGPAKPLADLTSKEADFRSPFLTADGKFPQYLYYSSNKDPEKRDRKGDNYDLYFLVKPKAGADFSYDNAVISADTELDEANPWVTPDRRHIYFSRKDKEGNWRLYVTSRPADGGQYAAPVMIEFPPNFHHATLTPDGKTMYLEGSLGAARARLFRSTFDGKSWALPRPLTNLNSREAPTGDRSPCLSPDGALLYFVSDRPGGKGGLDLWAVPTEQLK